MKRRDFGQLAAGGALSGMMPAAADSNAFEFPRKPLAWGVKHSLQIGGADQEFSLAAQLGMEYVNMWTTPARYQEMVDRAAAHRLKVAKIGNGSVHNRAEITLGLPGRDEKIEEFKQNLRSLAAAGIRYQTYAHMANGVGSSEPEAGRGGSIVRAFQVGRHSEKHSYGYRTFGFDRPYSEDELWKNYEYFVKRVTRTAEETGVKVGVHPDDPPGLTLGNVPRKIFSSFDGYKRALEIAGSPNFGICLCCGVWLEGGRAMGRNVLEAIEYFGGLKKLFVIHFRNVDRPLPHFRETFLNEGYMDMYQIMRALRKVNFDGVLIADHWPAMSGRETREGRLLGQVYTIGYIQALIERANEEAA